MNANDYSPKDLSARINAIDFIISMYFRSTSILSQHDIIEKRNLSTENMLVLKKN